MPLTAAAMPHLQVDSIVADQFSGLKVWFIDRTPLNGHVAALKELAVANPRYCCRRLCQMLKRTPPLPTREQKNE